MLLNMETQRISTSEVNRKFEGNFYHHIIVNKEHVHLWDLENFVRINHIMILSHLENI